MYWQLHVRALYCIMRYRPQAFFITSMQSHQGAQNRDALYISVSTCYQSETRDGFHHAYKLSLPLTSQH